MRALYEQLLHLVRQIHDMTIAVLPRGGVSSNLSKSTQAEYQQLAEMLLRRVRYTDRGLIDVVVDTTSPRTFHKRMAALRYFLFRQHQLVQSVNQASADQLRILQPKLEKHLQHLQALALIQRQGFQGPRSKRRSKRQALRGLPDDWRTRLYLRGANGKYATALLVLTLTGCRAYELVKGIHIWRTYDAKLGADIINLDISGAKVKATQGQPKHMTSYRATDETPLVMALNHLLDQQEEPSFHVKIDDARNLTVEIRRLAKSLWPKHKHSITANCFRHQWASDLKAAGDGDAVSKGLGHISAKTRRYYGCAGQASSTERLHPVRVEAERPIKGTSIFCPTTDHNPSP